MAKRRRQRLVTRVLVVDGEVHLIVERRVDGLVTRRLRGADLRYAIHMIDSWGSDIEEHARRGRW